jgi:hypothetical protein
MAVQVMVESSAQKNQCWLALRQLSHAYPWRNAIEQEMNSYALDAIPRRLASKCVVPKMVSQSILDAEREIGRDHG